MVMEGTSTRRVDERPVDVARERSVDRRRIARVRAECPVVVSHAGGGASFGATLRDVTRNGASFVGASDVSCGENLSIYIPGSAAGGTNGGGLRLSGSVIWILNEESQTSQCGVRLDTGAGEGLDRLLMGLVEEEVAGFIGMTVPEHVRELYRGFAVVQKLTQKEVMDLIDFRPPFLKFSRYVLFADGPGIERTRGLGVGVVTTADTAGHYHDTIFLALCGGLMGCAGAVHLSALFPSSAPQAVAGDGVKALGGALRNPLRPGPEGAPFFVETRVLNRRSQLVLMESKVTFGDVLFGTVEKLKMVVMPRDSIVRFREVGTVVLERGGT